VTSGRGEVVVTFLEFEIGGVLFERADLLFELVDVVGGAETGLVQCLLSDRLREALFELANPGCEANSTLVRVGQVGLQRCPTDGGSDACSVRRLGFDGEDMFEEIAVPSACPAGLCTAERLMAGDPVE
jgi:hypothetical protein